MRVLGPLGTKFMESRLILVCGKRLLNAPGESRSEFNSLALRGLFFMGVSVNR